MQPSGAGYCCVSWASEERQAIGQVALIFILVRDYYRITRRRKLIDFPRQANILCSETIVISFPNVSLAPGWLFAFPRRPNLHRNTTVTCLPTSS